MRLISSESLYQRFLDYQSKHRNRNLDIDEIRIVISDEPTVCDIRQIRDEIKQNMNRDIGGNDGSWVHGYKNGLGEALEIINEHTKGEQE